MSYIVEYFGNDYEVENVGNDNIIINGEEHYCPLDGDLEYGCKYCAYVADYKYNPKTGNCEEI